MILSLILILALSVGGAGLTYLFSAKTSLLWRLAAGCAVGSVLFGTAAFVLASLFGFSTVTAGAAFVLAMLPVVLLRKGATGAAFEQERALARNRVGTWNSAAGARFAYYTLFFLLFLFFFDRAMMVTDGGIFTGGSHNLGDLPFHLGAITSFVDGNNFPPQNPSFAGTTFSYPFIADLVTAGFVMFGISIRDAMHAQNVMWAFSLVVILERFVFLLVGDRVAAKIAPLLLMFSGGLGFLWFLSGWWGQSAGFFQFLGQMPRDYTLREGFQWGNSMTSLFLTQRGLLLGMPLTLMVLERLWERFRRDEEAVGARAASFAGIVRENRGLVVIGLLAGLLVMVHLHSLMVLFIVSVFLMMLKPRADFVAAMAVFGVSVGLVAVPELVWSMTGSSSKATEFFAWHFGWEKGGESFVWFWVKNTGIAIPAIAAGVYLLIRSGRREVEPDPDSKKKKAKLKPVAAAYRDGLKAALFLVPFVFIFIAGNSLKFAPWAWDNIKLLVYWYVVSAAFIAFFLAWLWRQATAYKIAAAVLLISLTAAGALDVWRVSTSQINWNVFSPDAVAVADRIKATTQRDALFVNAPTYNSAVVLSGRPSLMRYTGHLGSHGIDYREREQDIKTIYGGGPQAKELMRKWGVEYVIVSPVERSSLNPNEDFFRQYPITAQSGEYQVYRITD
ncbi:MAG: hypothetical protein H0V76_06300 [Blastocatellia bacterium]|nr:hypothetical protein [Blastocatellia bacterium]